MSDDKVDADPERGRQSVENAIDARMRDDEILDRATGVFSALRANRVENHWAEKIGRALRGAA